MDHQLAPDYSTARARFRAAVSAAAGHLEAFPLPEEGPAGEALAIDVARVGPADAAHVVFVVSGTHGVEGFAGSFCQSRWLEDHGSAPLPPAVATVWVHAHNPYGFAWVRRVNEDNVDLNRNYADLTRPPANDGYDELADALAPAENSMSATAAADAVLLDYADLHGFDALQAAVTGGQYRYPDGLFYGGAQSVRSQQVMRQILDRHLSQATRVAILDLHTGLGSWGEVELITDAPPGSSDYARTVSWWGEQVASTTAGESVSASLDGQWMTAAQQWLAPREVTSLALEWGTLDAVTVLQALRADNWLHHHGDPSGPEASPIKAELKAAFAPDDPAWAASVHACFDEVMAQTLSALG